MRSPATSAAHTSHSPSSASLTSRRLNRCELACLRPSARSKRWPSSSSAPAARRTDLPIVPSSISVTGAMSTSPSSCPIPILKLSCPQSRWRTYSMTSPNRSYRAKRRSCLSTLGAWLNALLTSSANDSAMRWSRRITDPCQRTDVLGSKPGSGPVISRRWSQRRRSNSASTSVRLNWSVRSDRRVRSRPSCNASGVRVTVDMASRWVVSTRRHVMSWSRQSPCSPRSTVGCSTRCCHPRRPSTSWLSRSSPKPPHKIGTKTHCSTWLGARLLTVDSLETAMTRCSRWYLRGFRPARARRVRTSIAIRSIRWCAPDGEPGSLR